MSYLRLGIVAGVLLSAFVGAQTQDLRVGVIVSQSGLAAREGQAQAQAAASLDEAWQNDFFAQRIDLLMRDDGSSPLAAAELTRELLESGVHALVCCTTSEALAIAAPIAQDAGVLLLSPSALPEDTLSQDALSQDNAWAFSVRPDTPALVRSALLQLSRLDRASVGLMALNTELGDEVLALLERLSVPGGAELLGTQRYRPSINVLTPEALWIATRQPGAVFVWGEDRDTRLALAALRERGFEGPVLQRPGTTPLTGSSQLISPYEFAADLSEDHPSFESLATFERNLAQLYGPGRSTLEGAYLYDALLLVKAGLEQALVYGVDPTNTERFRSALYDAFLASGEVAGVTAVFDFEAGSFSGVEPYSLLLVTRTARGLELFSDLAEDTTP